MALILESKGTQRCALDGNTVEPFTQKSFSALLSEAHNKSHDYYIAKVICAKDHRSTYYCYDARQLCKYIFEMIISGDGRHVQIKNFKDPLNQEKINELYFFRCRYDSESPLKAEYAGSKKDFLESQSFRSKIFFQEDPLDSLAVNFKFHLNNKIPIFTKRQIYTLICIVLFILLIGSILLFVVERNKTGSNKLLDYAVSRLNDDVT